MTTIQPAAWPEDAGEQIRARHPLRSVALFFAVVLLYSIITAIFFRAWIPFLHSGLIGPPEDNMQDFWNTWYTASASNWGRFFFTDLIRFPQGTPLQYHSFAYPKVFAIAVLVKLFGSDTSNLLWSHNLSLLISFPLAGVGAFYLLRYLTGNIAGALLGGFVFAFNPSHIEHVMHHAHVSSIEFIPAFVLCYLLAMERKSWPLLIGSAILYALNALSCWYYLFYIFYFIVFHTVYLLIRDRAFPRGWKLLTPVACIAGTIALLSPLLVPMVVAAQGSTSVYAGGHNTYVADLLAYPAFPPFHYLGPMADSINRRLSGNEWEATVYLGLVNIAVLVGLWFAVRRDYTRLFIYVLGGMAVFCVFASGSSLHVLGHRTIPMPDMVLAHLPFVRNVRTPSRAIVFVYLFLAIGVGHAAALAWRHRSRPAVRWGMAAVAGLIVLDFFPARGLEMTPVVCSPGFAVIRDDAEQGFGILDLPSGRPAAYLEGNLYMLQQAACHGRPILQGNTSRDMVVTLRDRLDTTDLVAQRDQLVAAKVKYIVLNHSPMGQEFAWRAEDGQQENYRANYQAVYDAPDLTILRVY